MSGQRRGGWGTLVRLMLAAVILLGQSGVSEAARIKDVASVEGVRENQLSGYGLVMGLAGSGDQVIGGQNTAQTILSMLNKMDINLVINPIMFLTKNIASVMVTAVLPPFAKTGQKIDVTVSSIANAKSLAGGTLLLSPLKAANQKVYAVAQGAVSVGGFLGHGGGGTAIKNHVLSGTIPGGAIVEKEVVQEGLAMDQWESLTLILHRADFTTALRIADGINGLLGAQVASAPNPGQVRVTIPEAYRGRVVALMTVIEGIPVESDGGAKIIINEKTGTVVMGEHVVIKTCAVSHGALTVTVKGDAGPQATPAPAAGAAAAGAPPTPAEATVEDERRVVILDQTVTLGEVVKALNAVGATPRDLSAILAAMHRAGALHGDLEII